MDLFFPTPPLLCFAFTDAHSLSYHFAVGPQTRPRQPWCVVQDQVDGKAFLYYDCGGSKIKYISPLGEEMKTTEVWKTQAETFRDIGHQGVAQGATAWHYVEKHRVLGELGWWECKSTQSLWKTVWRFLKNLGIKLPYDPAIPLLGIYPEETKREKDICIPIFIVALSTIAKTWKQPRYPSTDEWINKLWYIYTIEYYSAIKRNAFESVLMRWMNLEPIIQSEVSQKEKNKYHILTHIWRRQWHPTPVLLPGKSHGRRGLVGCSPWGR